MNACCLLLTENPIATAPSILSYLNDVASRHGIDKHIKFHHFVQSLDWRSDEQKWKIEVLVNGSEKKIFWASFVIMGTGYYDYNKVRSLEYHLTRSDNLRASKHTSPELRISPARLSTRSSGLKILTTRTRKP